MSKIVARAFFLPVCVLLLWQAAPTLGLVPSILLPAPTRVLPRAIALLGDQVVRGALASTVLSSLVGFVLGTITGCALGALAGISVRFSNFISPTIDFLRGVPVALWVPLAVLLFGLGGGVKIALAFAVTTLYVAVPAMQAARTLDPLRLATVRSRGGNSRQVLQFVVLPEIVQAGIVTGGRIAATLALAVVLVLEMLFTSSSGLGTLIMESRLAGRYVDAYALIVISGLLGLALNYTAVLVIQMHQTLGREAR